METGFILTHVLFNFELELVEKDKDWMTGMKVYFLGEA
jgi:hypothetical protein